MLPKPQCPFCGTTFETLGEALKHLDAEICHASIMTRPYVTANFESRDHVAAGEVEDPITKTVEEAG